jgi:hypothetical protein
MSAERGDYSGDATLWDLLISADDMVALLDFMIERMEDGETLLEAMKTLREKIEEKRTASWKGPHSYGLTREE